MAQASKKRAEIIICTKRGGCC